MNAARLLSANFPQPHDEFWTHTQLRALNDAVLARAEPPSAARTALPPQLGQPVPGFLRVVFVDGWHQPQWSDPAASEFISVRGPVLNFNDGNTDPDLRFAALSELHGAPAISFRVQQRDGDVSLEIVHFQSGVAGSIYPSVNLALAPNARLRLLERVFGTVPAGALHCSSLRIDVAQGARLTHHRWFDCGDTTFLLDQVDARLHQDALYQTYQLSVGGAMIRSTISTRLSGSGSFYVWNGVAVHRDNERFDALIRVSHDATQTRSEQLFRAITSDQAHVSCTSDVLVAATARGARIRQSLRGLNGSTAESKGAHINLRPRLTIQTDDIQASHGATTGQLDENLLYYLLTRGIDAATARAMLKWAFLGDVFAAIADPALRRAAEQIAAAHLSDQTIHELAGQAPS